MEFDKITSKSVYTKPTWEVFTCSSELNILETLSSSTEVYDYEWGGNLGGDGDWVDAEGDFL